MADHPFWPAGMRTLSGTTTTSGADITPLGVVPGDAVVNISGSGIGPGPAKQRTIVIDNAGPDRIFLNWGTTLANSAAVVASAKYTVPAGSVQTITIEPSANFISGICPTSTATVYIVSGRGA